MNEPLPTTISARPDDTRSKVAKFWNALTGSAALNTVTALVNRIFFVLDAAADKITEFAESKNSLR